jgi:hypothetical protein
LRWKKYRPDGACCLQSLGCYQNINPPGFGKIPKYVHTIWLFKEEYIEMLTDFDVAYEEKYLFEFYD